MSSTRIFKSTRRAAMLGAAVLLTSFGLAGTTAQAFIVVTNPPPDPVGAMSASLTLDGSSYPYEYIKTFASGKVNMTKTYAQSLINAGYRVQLRIYGADPFFDDFEVGPADAHLSATTGGLSFSTPSGWDSPGINWVYLDEDRELFGTDELYVTADLVYPSGGSMRSARSSEVSIHLGA